MREQESLILDMMNPNKQQSEERRCGTLWFVLKTRKDGKSPKKIVDGDKDQTQEHLHTTICNVFTGTVVREKAKVSDDNLLLTNEYYNLLGSGQE